MRGLDAFLGLDDFSEDTTVDQLVASGNSIAQAATNYISNFDPNNPDLMATAMPGYASFDMGNWSKALAKVAQAAASGTAPPSNAPSTPPAGGSTPSGSTAPAGAPIITGIADPTSPTPGAGAPGDTVYINGTNFTGTTSVDFNGVPAQFTVGNANQITATVPMEATTGPVHVVNAAGTGTSPTPFNIIPTVQQTTPDYGGGGGGGGYGGGGGGFGGGDGGGGGFDDGSSDDFDPEAASAEEAANIENSSSSDDSGGDSGSDDGSDDGGVDDGGYQQYQAPAEDYVSGDSAMLGLDVFASRPSSLSRNRSVVVGSIDVTGLQQRLDAMPQTNRQVWTLWSEPEPGFAYGHGLALAQRAVADAQKIMDESVLPTTEFSVHDAVMSFSQRAKDLDTKISKLPLDDNQCAIWSDVRSYFLDGSTLANTVEGVADKSIKWSDVREATKKVAQGVETGVKTVWWTTAALVAGGVALVGLVAWKLISSGTVRDVGTAALSRR